MPNQLSSPEYADDSAARGIATVRVSGKFSKTGERTDENVFDRFYRADASHTRQTGGTWLGLSIAQAIARQHGGHITAESQLGQGSTFTVWLPAQRQPS